ncbi:MAG TPA: endonuclease III [Euryarchaeota archaeon]|nr:endonuclease III [Euryarchaeota archaeon]
MQPDERVRAIIMLLKKEYPEIKSALRFTDPMQLLVATILSAQCTDLRVNTVTAGLFKKYKSAEDYANADPRVFEQEIRSTGFYRNKAKNIIGAARIIVEKYGGRVPDTMEELIQLPGVARKTANIVLANAYGKIEGIAVDTHVKRLSKLLGLTTYSDPVKIEGDLMKITPLEDWNNLNHLFVFHGRSVCIARRPKHDKCVLNWLCPSAGREFYH